MENDMKKRQFPLFWILYSSLTVLAIVAVVLLLMKLNTFLAAYEATRPVHEADKIVESVFLPDNKENLKKLITNTVDNGNETVDDMLEVFYSSIKGKELDYGRYFGHYSDEKPAYIVSAGSDQIASFTLKETVKYDKAYNFKLWEIESVTLTLQPKYGYAVTVPETMTLYVNGKLIPKTDAKGHKDSDCKVGYLEYSGAGFYSDPEIKVEDRLGQEVKLLRDEATGGYYYLLHYAYAPSDTEVAFNGYVFTENELMEDGIDSGVDFFMLKEVIKKYSEYNVLSEQITYPVFSKYYVDLYVNEEAEYTWKNKLGTMSTASYNADSRTFEAYIPNDETDKEELVEYARNFIETYSLFCSADKKASELKKFFPANSEYYEKISHLNNLWFKSHSNTSFQNQETKEYFGYADNLVYVHLAMEEKMKLTKDGSWATYPIDLPVWLVKIEDKWYIGSMDFDSFVLEAEK